MGCSRRNLVVSHCLRAPTFRFQVTGRISFHHRDKHLYQDPKKMKEYIQNDKEKLRSWLLLPRVACSDSGLRHAKGITPLGPTRAVTHDVETQNNQESKQISDNMHELEQHTVPCTKLPSIKRLWSFFIFQTMHRISVVDPPTLELCSKDYFWKTS